ncbi:PrsW family intramembrane metalloprotease [Brachybacterium sp. DNPG3]
MSHVAHPAVPPIPAPPGTPATPPTARPALAVVGPPAPATAPAPRRAAWYLRFSWVIALVAGLAAYIATFVIMLITQNPTMLPTVLLVGAGTIPLAVLLFAQTSRVGPMVPTSTVLIVASVGGLFAVCAAGLTEALAGAVLGRPAILLVGIIEETAKLVVPLIILALAHRATRGGGIVIGIAAGTGFAVLETMGYGFDALLSQNGGLGALDATLVLRAILVPAGHVAWTGAVCAALWHLVESSHKGRATLALVGAYVGAIVLHTAWDASTSGVLHVLIGLVSVVGLLWITIAAHRAFVRRQTAGALASTPA